MFNSRQIYYFILFAVPLVVRSQVNETINYVSYCYSNYEDENVSFKFYNRKTDQYQTSTIKNLTATTNVYNPELVTKLIITGQYSNYIQATPIVKGYRLQDVNIVVVDWSKYSGCSHRDITFRIVPRISALLTRSIRSFYKFGTSPEKLHLIGHSFGAHIMAMASRALDDQKASRVTGLDPGDGIYDFVPPDKRIDSNCASFVDVIHTNLGIDGIQKPVGQVDFFPNGGIEQPRCGSDNFCSHALSIDYFGESITTKIGFYSLPCDGLNLINTSGSSLPINESTEILMGEYVPHSVVGNYCLKTNTNPPYAKGFIERSAASISECATIALLFIAIFTSLRNINKLAI